MSKKGGEITEEYILNKLVNAKKTSPKNPLKDIVRLYEAQQQQSFNLQTILTFPA